MIRDQAHDVPIRKVVEDILTLLLPQLLTLFLHQLLTLLLPQLLTLLQLVSHGVVRQHKNVDVVPAETGLKT